MKLAKVIPNKIVQEKLWRTNQNECFQKFVLVWLSNVLVILEFSLLYIVSNYEDTRISLKHSASNLSLIVIQESAKLVLLLGIDWFVSYFD